MIKSKLLGEYMREDLPKDWGALRSHIDKIVDKQGAIVLELESWRKFGGHDGCAVSPVWSARYYYPEDDGIDLSEVFSVIGSECRIYNRVVGLWFRPVN